MKTYESSFYQKLNTIADWILRLVVINVLMILFSLPIITMYPALIAGYKLFTYYIRKREVPMVKSYWTFFKENFKQKFQIGLILSMALILGMINLTVYSDYLSLNADLMSVLGYYVMLALIFGATFVILYTMPIMVSYPNTQLWLVIKFAFFLSGKYILRTILALLILAIPLVLLAFPPTIVVFIFAGLSIPILLYAILFQKPLKFVEGLDKNKDSESDEKTGH